MNGERVIAAYVTAQRALDAIRRVDPADIADYEHTVKQKTAVMYARYGKLSGGQIGEARRRLAASL